MGLDRVKGGQILAVTVEINGTGYTHNCRYGKSGY